MNDGIVGIDLGTSTSEIAVFKDGRAVVIPNHLNELIIPSAVGLSADGKIIVGSEARDQLLLKPEDTVIEVKRLMGSDTAVTMGGKRYSPPQISSFILAGLINSARQYLGEAVARAVITVPAYFSDTQRRATVEAGQLAGIKVERIINEPTAATLDYGLEHIQDCRNILIYDLGGGTLDVTVLEMFAGVLEVKASSGNNRLGGKDFDQRLMDYLLNRFAAKHNLDPAAAVGEDKRALMRLKEAAEKCKMALSEELEYHLLLPLFAAVDNEPVSLDETVGREAFEGLIGDLVEGTAKQIRTALADANLEAGEIDLILLVGGSTRIPFVRHFIERTLGRAPQALIDPDLAVVRGAAIQGGILDRTLSAEKDIIITDVCPYTLGTAVIDFIGDFPVPDTYDVILPRNVTIPVIKEKTYGTVSDNQTQVEINIYQGEFKKASYNNFLGRFILKGIPPAPAFQEKINISFAYDVNGILQVEGKVVSTGRKANLVIETMGVKMEAEPDLKGWNKAPNARKYRAMINKAGRMIKKGEALFYAAEMESLISKIKAGLVLGEDLEILEHYREELHEMIYELTEEKDA